MRRKIEFQEPVDKTHQDAAAAISDMTYIIRRFGNLIREADGADTKSQMGNLMVRVEFLVRRRENVASDPFSYAFAEKQQVCSKQEYAGSSFKHVPGGKWKTLVRYLPFETATQES